MNGDGEVIKHDRFSVIMAQESHIFRELQRPRHLVRGIETYCLLKINDVVPADLPPEKASHALVILPSS